MALQLQDIVTRVYWNLSVDEDSKTYDRAVRVVPKINSVYKQICRGEYRSLLQDITIKGGDLRFLRGKMFIEDYEVITTTAEVNDGDTNIPVTSVENIPNTGYAMIGGCVFKYGFSTTGLLSGVTGLMGKHERGSCVYIVHKIPDDARKAFELFLVNRDGKLEEQEYIDYRYQSDRQNYYTIMGNDTDSEQFVHLCLSNTKYNYRLYYIKDVDRLFGDTNTTVFPEEEFDHDMLSMIVSGELLRETEKSETAKMQLTEGYAKLIDFYNAYRVQNKDFKQTLKRRRRTPSFYYTRRYR